jgi:O-methyltransferase involved in polyketide biosynthesis
VARTDDDSWEITESVGATALGVAAARAADTESDDPLISDPFARVFLDRVGDGVWNWYGAPELPAAVVEAEPDMPQRMRALVNYFATRTKFFDTSFLEATNAGIRQAVILAAGLDARSWRLPWPDGLRARPGQGVGLQSVDVARARCRTDMSSCRRCGGPASGLANGVAAGWV